MDYNSEKAEIIRKLARKNNWGHKYDRLEHVKNPRAKATERAGFLSTRDLCLLTHERKQRDCANTNARCFKRFQNLDKAIKELSNQKWLLVYKKPNFTGIALNSEFKKEIIEFVKKVRPDLSDLIS